MFWPTTSAMVGRTPPGDALDRHVDTQWLDVLPHEAMHALMAAHFYAAAARSV